MPDAMGLIVLGACFAVGFAACSFMFARGAKQKPALDAAVPGMVPWYVVLDVAADSSADVIQQAYQQWMAAYHPEQIAVFNAGTQQMAEQKRLEITVAYDTAMRLRGSWR